MRAILLLVLSVAAVVAEAPPEQKIPPTISSLIDAPASFTIKRSPSDPHIVAIYAESDPQWWGLLNVYHRTGDTIDWQFAFPESYEKYRGHYVVRFRWISLEQITDPVLEVIESTHMGNGSLRLFAVQGRELRSLLDTAVRGRFFSVPPSFGVPEDGEAHFEGPHLSVDYEKSKTHSADSVILTGSLRIADMSGTQMRPRTFSQTCVWDESQKVFIAQPPISP